MTSPETEQKRLYLRASIKLMVAIGFLFLLIPFCSSIFRDAGDAPAEGTLLQTRELAEGATTEIMLPDGSTRFVTRNSTSLRHQLQSISAGQLWYSTPPGLLESAWLVLAAQSAAGEPIEFKPADAAWPGGFVTTSGVAWDLAGRALKQTGPGNSSDASSQHRKSQNLPAMPYRRHGDGILLLPLPQQSLQSSSPPTHQGPNE